MNKTFLLVGAVVIGFFAFSRVKGALNTAGKNVNAQFKGLDVDFKKITFTSLPGTLKLELSNPSGVNAVVSRIIGNISVNAVQIGSFSGGPVNIAAYGTTGIALNFSLNVLQLATAAGMNFAAIAAGNIPPVTARGVLVVNGLDVPFEFTQKIG